LIEITVLFKHNHWRVASSYSVPLLYKCSRHWLF